MLRLHGSKISANSAVRHYRGLVVPLSFVGWHSGSIHIWKARVRPATSRCEARLVKPNLCLAVVGTIGEFQVYSSGEAQTATIEVPYESIHEQKYILFRVQEVRVINSRDGSLLASFIDDKNQLDHMEAGKVDRTQWQMQIAPQIKSTAKRVEPVLLSKVRPAYPMLAKAARIQGGVEFDVNVDVHGKVNGMNVVRGHPLLETAARDAVSQYTFSPGTLDGEPTEMTTRVIVEFRMDNSR